MHVKKGDTVIIIAGNDKGKTGEITAVRIDKQDAMRNRVIVGGLNLRWKHKKPTQEKPKGERVQESCSVHHSNVMLYDPASKKGTRKRPAETKK
jgi:large subunit ribosomal protein L24